MIQYNEKDRPGRYGDTIKSGDIFDLARENKDLSELIPDEEDAEWLGIDLKAWKYVPTEEDKDYYENIKAQYERGRKQHGDKFVLINYVNE